MVRVKKFFDDGEDVFGMDRNCAFFLHNFLFNLKINVLVITCHIKGCSKLLLVDKLAGLGWIYDNWI